MTTETFEAWFLHKHWCGDTSAYVVFFSREKGIVRGLLKGGRTPKKQALLQTFMPLCVTMAYRYGRGYVQSIEPIASVLGLSGIGLFSGLYLNELIFYGLREHDPSPELYDVYVATLPCLAQTSLAKTDLEATLRRFERALLMACGYHLELSTDANGMPIDAVRYYAFQPGHGFFQEKHGLLGEHILQFSQENFSDSAVLKAAKWIMRQAIDHALDGRRIKTRELFTRVHKVFS